ncbi:hypothetical protein ANCDUO_27108, partial [Ancylostoma duodenale]
DNNFNAKILNYKIVDDGKFAVSFDRCLYTIQITVDSYTWTVERRYSEFDLMDMRRFPDRKKSFLPPKRLIRNLVSFWFSRSNHFFCFLFHALTTQLLNGTG